MKECKHKWVELVRYPHKTVYGCTVCKTLKGMTDGEARQESEALSSERAREDESMKDCKHDWTPVGVVDTCEGEDYMIADFTCSNCGKEGTGRMAVTPEERPLALELVRSIEQVDAIKILTELVGQYMTLLEAKLPDLNEDEKDTAQRDGRNMVRALKYLKTCNDNLSFQLEDTDEDEGHNTIH